MKLRFDFKKIKKRITKVFRFLAERAFLTFCVLWLMSLIFSGFVFYQYVILLPQKEPQITTRPASFKEKTYEEVLGIWQEREEKFNAADSVRRPNPFKAATSTP